MLTNQKQEKCFSVKAGPKYHNKSTGFASYFLSFGDGETKIEIMSRKEVDVNNLLEALGYNHIAISVGSKEAVDEITRKLKKDGYAIQRNLVLNVMAIIKAYFLALIIY